jgi:hypothetical protein
MNKLLLTFAFAALAASSAVQAETVYFTEDFEWIAPWTDVKATGKTVEDDNLDANAPKINSPAIDGVTVLDELTKRGYEVKRVTPSGETTDECIYLQKNYLKFGKTGYQAGIILPAITEIPTDTKDLTLSFNWCPMRQGATKDNKVDPVTLLIQIVNGTDTITVDTTNNATLTHDWANGTTLRWIDATVDLSNVNITSTSRIFIKQTQWGVSTAHRWFLDNIKVYKNESSSIETAAVDDENTTAEYFNLQGVRVANPTNGIYVKRQGNKATKVLVK